jgi:HEXXH motif-containing protein
MARRSPVDELVQLLSWRDPAHHDRRCAALELSHATAVAGKLDAKLDRATRALLGTLSSDRYFAILRGPETYNAVYFGLAPELAPRVARWIAVEVAGPGAETRLDGRIASASLDRYVHARDRRVLAIELLPWLPTTQIAIELSGKLLTRARLPVRRHDTVTVAECALTVDRLDRAMQLLRTVSPNAADAVMRFISVATVRSSSTDVRFVSAGDPTTPGVIHVINAHLPGVTHVDLATALVREMVNQALYRWELDHVLLQTAEDVLVPSPWTGRALSLYGFVHACFAWYAVGSLWSLRSAPRDGATMWVDDTEVGFARRPLDGLGELARHLPSAVAGAIASMTHDFAPTVVRRTSRG